MPSSTFRYGPGDYSLAISLVERGLVDLKPLVTHRYKFKDALEAFQVTEKGKDANGKVSLRFNTVVGGCGLIHRGVGGIGRHQVYNRWTGVKVAMDVKC